MGFCRLNVPAGQFFPTRTMRAQVRRGAFLLLAGLGVGLKRCAGYFTFNSSTSKYKVEFGGMSSPRPAAPYPSLEGTSSFRLPPTFMVETPSSRPWSTSSLPNENEKGLSRSNVLSNFLPWH